MPCHLFFICPTDFIEGNIRKYFRGDKMFITSLGNSLEIDEELIVDILEMVEGNEISAISFILANDNLFFQTALSRDKLVSDGLKKLGQIITKKYKEHHKLFPSESSTKRSILNFLSKQSNTLQKKMKMIDSSAIEFNCLIYSRQHDVFTEITSALFHYSKNQLN